MGSVIRNRIKLVLAIPLAVIIGVVVLGYGYIKYHEIRHLPYAVDGQYRTDCPIAPELFPYVSNRPETVIEMGKYKFVYPHGYGLGYDLPRYLPDGRIYDQMQLIYPEMRPSRDSSLQRWQLGVNRVYIDIAYHPDGKRHFGISRKLQDKSRIAEPEVVQDLGLTAYKDKLLPRYVLKYTPIDASIMAVPGYPLKLECINTLAYPGEARGSCDVVFPLRETIWIRYGIFSEYLPCWRQIHDAVYRITNSFIKENN